MKYLFLDTNIYLHYKDIEEIDWRSLVTAGDDFTIVIPPIVIREIDKIKDRERGKIQARAKKISSKFGDIFLGGKKMKLNYQSCEDPSNDLFEEYKFNEKVYDDWFVLSAKSYNTELDDVIIIAGDNGVLMKAKNSGLAIFRMKDDFLLKEEISEEEKEYLKIKKEYEQIKKKRSDPKIFFEDGSTILRLRKPIPKILEEEVEKCLEKEKLKYPYDTTYDTGDSLGVALMNSMHSIWGQFSAEQAKNYNNQLNDYYKDYEEYIRFVIQNKIYSERMRELKFVLSNLGNAQTGDMNIAINFPDNIKLYDNRSRIRRIEDLPVLPQKNGLDRKMLKIIQNNRPIIGNPLQGYSPNYEYCWELSKILTENEYSFTKTKLNYAMQLDLKIENSIFIDVFSCGSFNIDWCIIDSSLMEPVCGKLNVIVEK